MPVVLFDVIRLQVARIRFVSWLSRVNWRMSRVEFVWVTELPYVLSTLW